MEPLRAAVEVLGVNGGGDGVEVAGANLTLVLDGGEATLFGSLELALLQVDECVMPSRA